MKTNRKKSIGNAAPVIIEKSSGSTGAVLPLLAVAGIGVIGYFGFDYINKKREENVINKANESSLKHDLSLIKTKQDIDKIETTKGYVTGVNAFGKKVTINIFVQVKEAINQFYNVVTDKYNNTVYFKKSIDNIDQSKIKEAFFNTPVLFVDLFSKLYNIYTGQSFINDARKLDQKLYYSIKAIFEASHKKKNVKGLGTVSQNLL